MKDGEKTIVTEERKFGKMTKADDALFKGPYIEISSSEELMDLAKAAEKTKEHFDELVKDMTVSEATRIRELRCVEGGTWRYVAEVAYDEDICGGEWAPPSNQLMGMALCEKAAVFFGEDYMKDPWN